MKDKALAYLRKELYKAKTSLNFAVQRPNVKNEELAALREKIGALEWLIDMLDKQGEEDDKD